MKRGWLIGLCLVAATAMACGSPREPTVVPTAAHRSPEPTATRAPAGTRVVPVVPPAPPVTFSGTPLEKGRQAFALHCSACHGGTGQGLGSAIPPINTSEFLGSRTDEQLRQVISDGLSDQGMPASKGRLSPEDIDNVILFMRSWQK
jgi:mono/diheme cytochrome c family protein